MRFLHSLMQIKMQEYEHIIIYYIGGGEWDMGKTESKASPSWAADVWRCKGAALAAWGVNKSWWQKTNNDNVNKINEHGSLGWSRMIIHKNIWVTIWFLTLNCRKLYVKFWIRIDKRWQWPLSVGFADSAHARHSMQASSALAYSQN